jgi:hypothetical protein
MSQPPSPVSSPAPADQPSPAARPVRDSADVLRLIHQEVEKEKGYLKFAQEQSEKDRAYFEHLFKWAVSFLGLLIAASAAGIAFFGFNNVSELRDEMRTINQ